MTVDQIIILASGTGAILFVAWYFFGKQDKAAEVFGSSISIKVDAGYSPANILIKKNQTMTLKILRTDPSDCLEQIVIPEWHISRRLPLNKEVSLKLKADNTGEFPFHCGMNMFHGKIIVK